MSADAAPAAVPSPNDPPTNATANTPATGFLTSMLTPVEPARTAAFSLDPQTADSTPATSAELSAEGTSSAAFHGDGDGQKSPGSDASGKGAGKPPQSVWRAWMLAGAARWARGGGTQNKRLDMKKARAAAHQVKESRTVNSGPVTGPGRSPSASGGGSKSLDRKTSKGTDSAGGGARKEPKNSTGRGGPDRAPARRDNKHSTDKPGVGPKGSGGTGAGRGTSSGGTSSDSKGTSPAPKKPTPTKTDTPAPKPSKTAPVEQKSGKPAPVAGGATGGKGAAGSAGKDGATPKSGATPKGAKNTPDGSTTKDTKETPATGRKKWSLTKDDKTAKGGTTTPPATADGTKPGTGNSKTDPKTTTEKPKSDTPAAPKPPGGKGKPFTTRPSRETGYRDGTRAATAAAHAKAYRDGLSDGWADTTAAADREKARLDQAHAARKEARDKEQPVTTPASSADHHQAKPIEVTSIDDKQLHLGEGAAKTSVTRGEVRTLKGFERRLDDKTDVMGKVADGTKALKAHAEDQAKKATRLLEAAKSVEGGDKLVGDLAKLADAAAVQSEKAGEIHKRAVRAGEACRVVLTNVETRYGGMYKAVVDSDETAPAELTFYKG